CDLGDAVGRADRDQIATRRDDGVVAVIDAGVIRIVAKAGEVPTRATAVEVAVPIPEAGEIAGRAAAVIVVTEVAIVVWGDVAAIAATVAIPIVTKHRVDPLSRPGADINQVAAAIGHDRDDATTVARIRVSADDGVRRIAGARRVR